MLKQKILLLAYVCLATSAALSPSITAAAIDCLGSRISVKNSPVAWALSDGGLAAYAKMKINADGIRTAYHPGNPAAGAILSLCNAGKVFLPDGSSYQGSESNATCTGKFMADVAKIRAAGWKSPSVGAVNWFGVLGQGSAVIAGTTIDSVVPVLQNDGSGFYVSPTALADRNVTDPADQSRYVNALTVPAAVVPGALKAKNVVMGSFGVAFNTKSRISVPFVVGDAGPRIGEGSVALARLASGLPLKDPIEHKDRFAGAVDTPLVLWIFFADARGNFDSTHQDATVSEAKERFEKWGGDARVASCVSKVPK